MLPAVEHTPSEGPKPDPIDDDEEGIVRVTLSLDRELPFVLACERRRYPVMLALATIGYLGLIWLDRQLYAAQVHGFQEFALGLIVGSLGLLLAGGEALRRHIRNDRVREMQWMCCERCLADLRHAEGHGRCPECDLPFETGDLRRRWRKALDHPRGTNERAARVEPELISRETLKLLRDTCPEIPGAGLREPFAEWPEGVAAVEPARAVATERLRTRARLTRAILFDKAPGRNWSLDVHQDTTVALAERGEAATRFGPWSLKHGVWHAEASAELLRRMVTVRLHLDDADEENGCLLVASSGDHAESSKLGPRTLERLKDHLEPVPVLAGDAVVMSPLTPHASGRNTTHRHRRVLHMEFAGEDPGGGLRWRDEAEILGSDRATRP